MNGIVIIILIIFAIAVTVFFFNAQQEQIEKWIQSQGMEVQSIENRFLDRGPFTWFKNNTKQPVWRVETKNHRIFWFHRLFIGLRVYEEVDGQYTEIATL